MWKLKSIEAENLCAFRSLAYTLQQGVTTLIFGNNKDNDSQQSNGAGKSALLECIAVGLTGGPLRKIRTEEIINDAAEQCRIILHLANDASNEELIIARSIPRKGASTVACKLYRGGELVTTDEAVQHSVDAYNKYILEKLGITREELLNNFILSKYRYEDFLSSSDKEKKEIINRFSNGILVDEAIARVEEDIEPLSSEQQKIDLELAGIDGRIEMLQEQIAKEVAAGEERGRNRETRIAELEEVIASKREYIRTHKETLTGILALLIQRTDRQQDVSMGIMAGRIRVMDTYISAHAVCHKLLLDVLCQQGDLLIRVKLTWQGYHEFPGKATVLAFFRILHGVPEDGTILPLDGRILRQKHPLPHQTFLACVVMVDAVILVGHAGAAHIG